MLDFFFTTSIPDTMRFQSFGIWHGLYILTPALAIWLIIWMCRHKSPEENTKLLRAFTWALPVMYLHRFTVFALLDYHVEPQMPFLDRLPLQLCTMNAIIMPIAVKTRMKFLLNYIYGICLPGAAAAMLTPAMSYYGKYAPFSWQVFFFFLDHALMAFVPIFAVSTGFFRPDIRYAPKILGIFGIYAACMYPLNKLLDQNFLFLNYPDQGTVMAFFASYLGNPGYLLPLAGMVVFIVGLLFLPWYLYRESTNKTI